MPSLPTESQKTDSIQLSSTGGQQDSQEDLYVSGGKWEDEEERRFYEDIQDLRDYVPKSILGIDEDEKAAPEADDANHNEREKQVDEDVKQIEDELSRLQMTHAEGKDTALNGHAPNGKADHAASDDDDEDELVALLNFSISIHHRQ